MPFIPNLIPSTPPTADEKRIIQIRDAIVFSMDRKLPICSEWIDEYKNIIDPMNS